MKTLEPTSRSALRTIAGFIESVVRARGRVKD
jgi:hypothetical protein